MLKNCFVISKEFRLLFCLFVFLCYSFGISQFLCPYVIVLVFPQIRVAYKVTFYTPFSPNCVWYMSKKSCPFLSNLWLYVYIWRRILDIDYKKKSPGHNVSYFNRYLQNHLTVISVTTWLTKFFEIIFNIPEAVRHPCSSPDGRIFASSMLFG